MPFGYKPNPLYDGTLSTQYYVDGMNISDVTADQASAAGALVDAYQTNISAFVASNRQFANISGQQQISRWLNLPGVEVNFLRNGKKEILRINAHPSQGSSSSTLITDFNFDGYFAFAYTAIDGGLAFSVDIKINGVKVTNFSNNGTSVFNMQVIAFGPTAVQCQSVNDQNNPLLNGGKGLQCLPPRAKVTGSEIGEHPDCFGYFQFNFADPSNPLFTSNQWSGSQFQTMGGKPNLEKIIWYPNASESPLDLKTGNNQLTSHLSSGSFFGVTGVCTWAEFYSNASKDKRAVTQTWKKPALNNTFYLVNDKPVTDINANLSPSHTDPPIVAISVNLSSSADHSQDNNGQGDYSEFIVGNNAFGDGAVNAGSPNGGTSQTFTSWGEFQQALKRG